MRSAASATDNRVVPPGALPPQGGPIGTFELLRRWQTYLEVSGEAAATTRLQYRRYMVAFLADTLIELGDVDEDVIVAHLAALPERGEMRTQTLKALKSLYRFACARELVPQAVDPAGRLRIRRRAPGPVNALEREELERLLAAAEAIDPRARPALELAYATGARLGSLCAIMPADVGLGTVKLLEVPLGDRGRRAAARLLELIDYTPPTVLTRRPTLVGVGPGRVWQWTNAAALRAGLKASPHTLRRTFGTRLAENPDVDVRSWIELMGHADASQMRRYAKASDKRLRSAVEAL